MNEFGVVAAVLGLAALCGWVRQRADRKQEEDLVEIEQAVGALLDFGGELTLRSWHLYRGYKDEYVLLKFDHKSNPVGDSEERFPSNADGRSDAIKKFLRKVR
jgi:hypothetical protein